MIFAIHQPNYIPFSGYFCKIATSDIFVFLDTVQYPRGKNFSARNRIKTPQGAYYLTIPVSFPHGREGKVSYMEIYFLNDEWKKKHIKTLEMNYKKAPYYNEIMAMYSEILLKQTKFVELNIELILKFCDYLSIQTKFIRLSELPGTFGNKTNLIIDIAKKIDADVYLSGQGAGREYNDEQLLNRNRISLIYSDFKHPEYPQLWGDFIPNLSVIDMLFNCGAESKSFLFSKH